MQTARQFPQASAPPAGAGQPRWSSLFGYQPESRASDAPARQAQPQPSTGAAPRPILVVEDDAAVQTMLLMALEDADYLVEVATNGQEALEQLEQLNPFLILLDMRMPVMDGPTFLRTLYNQARRPIPPIIVMTAYRDADPTAAALGLPSISKPMDMAQLMHLVAQYAAS